MTSSTEEVWQRAAVKAIELMISKLVKASSAQVCCAALAHHRVLTAL